jgi:HPt (histidine-containing phosphotransfer) domain-containing protein
LAELKVEYRSQFPTKIRTLESAFQKEDWLKLADELHKLKGTGKTYGFPEVSSVCEALEDYCRLGHPQAEKIRPAFALFERMLAAWEKGEHFDLKQDPTAREILQLGKERS